MATLDAVNRYLLAAALATSPLLLAAQGAVGTWRTVDDETGEAKSEIEIYERGGKLYGRIAATLRADAPATCETCSGERAGRPYVGMEIVTGVEPDGELAWDDGEIYDPQADKTYGLSLWLEPDDLATLYVRGRHWTGLYRTQEWERVE